MTTDLELMSSRKMSPKEFLTFYRNTWMKIIVARSVDVVTDTVLKKEDPEQMVNDGDMQTPMQVKERLEQRKIAVQDAMAILAGIDTILAELETQAKKEGGGAKSFEDLYMNAEYLKVAEDMLPKKPEEPVVGGTCQLDGGKGEGVYAEMDGKMICVEKPATNEGGGATHNRAQATQRKCSIILWTTFKSTK